MVSIIGAGPAGCAVAYLLAKNSNNKGKINTDRINIDEVNIYEEHKSVGEPVQCTGIVSSEFRRLVRLRPEFVVNKIYNARIFSPNGNNIEISFRKPNIILDRWAFDNHLAEKAESAGARINLDSKFLRLEGNTIVIRKQKKLIRVDNNKNNILIGADGPNSSVARAAGMTGRRKFLFGAQAVVRIDNDNAVEFYPHIGTFGWVVPENDRTARVGVLAYSDTPREFRKLLKLKGIRKSKIIEKQGGIVPVYNNSIQTYKRLGNNGNKRGLEIFLLGDAASQVKATTGGGIVQGLTYAKSLADSILYKKDYEKQWKKEISMDLWMHLKARNIMDRFSNKDWNRLIEIFSAKKNREVLGKIERDNFSKLILRLALQEPRLWQFAGRLFR